MSGPEIDIQLRPDGKVTVHIHGVQGQECMELADLIRDILGTEDSRQKTSEYFGPGTRVHISQQAQSHVRHVSRPGE